MEQHLWFKRKFNFSYQENIFPSLLERLDHTGMVIRRKVEGQNDNSLRAKLKGKWSVLEHIGHLTDLEPLWQQRIDDIKNGAEVMAAADLLNTKTHEANHNNRDLSDLLAAFEQARNLTLEMFHDVREDEVFIASLHPRLMTPMRMIDLALFVAEHDVHHLVSINDIIQSFEE